MNCRKLIALPLLMLSMMAMTANAQTLKNFLDNKDSSFTWLGVDFTQAKLLGDAAAKTDAIVDHEFTALNQVIVNEQKKYDVPGALHRDKYNTSIGLVNKRNEAINKDALKSDESSDFERLKPEDIVKVVKSYDFTGKHGIGVMLVMEGMSKTSKSASMWLAIFDMDKKNVLLTERYVGKGQKWSFAWRNYWLATIKSVLDDIDDDYSKLKTKYAEAKDPEEPKPVVAAPAAKKETKAAGTTTPATKKPKKKG
ncbi:hypothetical protein SAMN05660461_3257 [Chitinophaga ginsengisegetis]|uniref:Uncharacterized protein n=1 Tax=Chitinophaga ginsengisegetis TaxID=393003 RepID=A0A1T5P015_9BACT|nr:hypothetical protein [Chitinophaga ginsengisegetis]SKD05977.1 hypothetical protein SAMN05660461_3257 [Chitinophaga ginsengisegetis]